MGLFGWIFYIFMGLLCFLLLLVFEKKYLINKKEKFAFSLIYLLIVSGFCYRYNVNVTKDIFLIFVFTFITDIIYTNYFLDLDFFDKSEGKISYYIILILIGFIINQELINKVNQVFLTGEELRLLLWTLGFIFIYKFIGDKKNDSLNNDEKKYISKERILEQYAKLKYQYYDECNHDDKDFSNLLIAIMIYHNHKRNNILRKIDYIMFRFNGNSKKLGIMQVETNKYITDKESILLCRKELEKIRFKNNKSKKIEDISKVIKKYSKDDEEKNNEINYIFEIIKKF